METTGVTEPSQNGMVVAEKEIFPVPEAGIRVQVGNISKPKLLRAALKATQVLRQIIDPQKIDPANDKRPARVIEIERALNTTLNFDCNHKRVVALLEVIMGHKLNDLRPEYGSSGDQIKIPFLACIASTKGKRETDHSYERDEVVIGVLPYDSGNLTYDRCMRQGGEVGNHFSSRKNNFRAATDDEVRILIEFLPQVEVDRYLTPMAAFLGW